jgi:hypothetical protein
MTVPVSIDPDKPKMRAAVAQQLRATGMQVPDDLLQAPIANQVQALEQRGLPRKPPRTEGRLDA